MVSCNQTLHLNLRANGNTNDLIKQPLHFLLKKKGHFIHRNTMSFAPQLLPQLVGLLANLRMKDLLQRAKLCTGWVDKYDLSKTMAIDATIIRPYGATKELNDPFDCY